LSFGRSRRQDAITPTSVPLGTKLIGVTIDIVVVGYGVSFVYIPEAQLHHLGLDLIETKE
jgi:hypothetical protein